MVADYLPRVRDKHTLAEYYAMLEGSERRWEFWDGEFLCMAGASPEHTIICSNVDTELAQSLKQKGCRILGSDTIVKTPSLPPFRFPDLTIVCGKLIFEPVDRFKALTNPIVLIEVLSTSTEHLDREPKRLAYQALPSVQEYLLIAQSVPHVTRFLRKGRKWQRFEYGDMNAVIELSSVACELPLREVYRDVEFN